MIDGRPVPLVLYAVDNKHIGYEGTTMRAMIHALVVTVLLAAPAASWAALASASTGKAVTSANLSTNPTIRKQQLLCDPEIDPDPLTLTFARLDVAIHLDTPLGYTAQDIISSITVSPLPHFFAVGTMPFYYAGEASSGVTFDGRDVLISNFTVQYDPQNPPPPGEVDHALVDVSFNNLLPANIYNNVLGTYTVQPNPDSLIQGTDGTNTYNFPGPDIIPATDSEVLGAPEPATMGIMTLGLMGAALRRRPR